MLISSDPSVGFVPNPDLAAAVVSTPAVDPAADTAPVAANTPNPAFVAAPSLVVGNNPDFPADTMVGIPLLSALPAQQKNTPLPAATPVRNYRRMPHREAEVPRIRDIRMAPEPWLRSGLRRTLCKRQRLPSPPHRIPGNFTAQSGAALRAKFRSGLVGAAAVGTDRSRLLTRYRRATVTAKLRAC